MTVPEQIAWCRAALRAGPLCSWEVAEMVLPLLDRLAELDRHETSTPEGEPMARKTPKPKMQSYQRVTREVDPHGVYPVLDECLEKYRRDLVNEDCRIAIAFRHGWKRNKDGHLILGKCVKASELNREFAAFDFVIVLNFEAWRNLNPAQRVALMHHELCHAAVAEDQNGSTKKDSRNRTCFRTRRHDVEEFGDVIAAHGCYKQDLENFVATAMRSAKPPAPTLLDGVLAREDQRAEPIPMPAAAQDRPAPTPRGRARKA